MRRLFALTGIFLCLASPGHAAPVLIGGGVEQFVWQEYDSGDNKLVKESGRRLFVGVEVEDEVSDRWTYGFRGRLYSGSVDCDGQLKAGGSCSSSDTDHDGIAMVADFTGRFIGPDGNYSNLGLRFGIGGEAWRRHISGGGGYNEEYFVAYGNLGLAYVPEQGLFGEAGLKYPFSVDEDIDLYDEVSVSPQGAFSLYAAVGYNFNHRWSIKAFYDSYRFKESDTEPLTSGGVAVSDVTQPESAMDRFGVTVGFYF